MWAPSTPCASYCLVVKKSAQIQTESGVTFGTTKQQK